MPVRTASRPLALVLMAASTALAAVEPLPEGSTGIASHHPGDAGIAADPAVIFADDFESYASAADLPTRWNAGVYHHVRIATEPGMVFAGAKAVEFTVPQQSAELSNTIARHLSPERDVVFLRYYAKLDPRLDVIGSSHNGFGVSAHYEDANGNSTPGIPADGYNKFLVTCECWRGEASTPNPGDLNSYVYHPEQRSQWGDHFFPTGIVSPFTSTPFPYGAGFVSRPDVVPQLGRWYCYELMVQANTPGVRDGRIAFWLDGVLTADFVGLRLRDTAALTMDEFSLSLHIGSNTAGEAKKWCDNVVVATAYIGPMSSAGGTTTGGATGSTTGGTTGGATGGATAGSATAGTTGSDRGAAHGSRRCGAGAVGAALAAGLALAFARRWRP